MIETTPGPSVMVLDPAKDISSATRTTLAAATANPGSRTTAPTATTGYSGHDTARHDDPPITAAPTSTASTMTTRALTARPTRTSTSARTTSSTTTDVGLSDASPVTA